MKFKSISKCHSEVTLENSEGTQAYGTASATASAKGNTSTLTITKSDNLSLINAYDLAYKMASSYFTTKNLILKDTTNTITNNCIEYIYTNPNKIEYKKPFTLYYKSDNININNTFQLTYKDKVLSTFEPNTVLTKITNGYSKISYFSNVTINPNTHECFISYNIIPNKILTINKDNGNYNEYLTIKDGLQEPVGVEFDEFNNMYVANFVKSNIKVYNPNKELIYIINDVLFRNLGGIGFYKGKLYVLNGLPINDKKSPYYKKFIIFETILSYDNKNNVTSSKVNVFCTDTLSAPLFICFDKFNYSYVTNYFNNTISKINMTTGEAEVYIDETKGILKPRGITIDKELNLYVSCGDVSTKTFFISKIDSNKIVTTYTTKNLNSPRGLALDIEGDQSLYICNLDSKLIKIIRDKYIFDIQDNILEKGDNILVIKDVTNNLIIDTFTLNIK